ncbi:membrane protein [Arthrobacter phage Elesar]|uniref:Membrane protein n=1 Tax=Arthrobacter phage Elesar TaxID=2510522 RepID=A0A411CQT8_9CAUD|nr:membrane protein [Arthrobacter phage Elesar]QAY16083.1 membrane protein [Arthrobacter phage Elesar]
MTSGGKLFDSAWRYDFGWYAATLGVVAAVVLAAIFAPIMLLAIPAAVVAYGLWKLAWFRLLFFVFGAFFVFQSGDGLSIQKLGYMGGAAFASVVALYNLHKAEHAEWRRKVRPALWGAALLAGWIVIPTLIQSVGFKGVPIEMWARDALTYLLISAGVVIGADAGRLVTARFARLTTVAVGLLAAAAFAVTWINRRGFGQVEDDSQGFILGSMVAITLPLALCLVFGLGQRGVKFWWLIPAPLMLTAVLVTGTRTGFVLSLVLLGIVGAVRKCRVRLSKALFGVVVGAGAIAAALPIAGAWLSSEQFVQQRIDLMLRTIQLGFAQDNSGLIRERARQYCMEIFAANPLMGQGLGIYFPNPNPNSAPANFTLDTFAVYPAKFGIIGTAVVVAALLMMFSTFMRKQDGGWLLESTAVRGSFVVCIALLPFGAPTEDKGFALNIALAAALVCAAARERSGPLQAEGVQHGPGELGVTSRGRVNGVAHHSPRVGGRVASPAVLHINQR